MEETQKKEEIKAIRESLHALSKQLSESDAKIYELRKKLLES